MKTILVTGNKGGTGKSTISCLLTEWLIYNDFSVHLLDADPNETTTEWLSDCKEQGRQIITTRNPDFRIIDSGGSKGAGVSFVVQADLILCPFQPLAADVSRVASWFVTLEGKHQDKVIFIPNRLKAPLLTVEQRSGIFEIEKLTKSVGRGRVFHGLTDRLAVYPLLFNGSSGNFFETDKGGSYRTALEESDELFRGLLGILGLIPVEVAR